MIVDLHQLLRPVRLTLVVIAVALVTATGTISSQGPEIVTIQADKDTTLYEDPSGAKSNGAGRHIFTGVTNETGIRRALLAFDVAKNLPSETTIVSVNLKLWMSKTHEESGVQIHPVSLHRVLADWGESSSDAPDEEGAGTRAVEGDATWGYTFFAAKNWDQAGGDFIPEPSAVSNVGGDGSYSWSSEQMIEDVQLWLKDPHTNFGWLIRGDESKNMTAKRFDSREHPTKNRSPMLELGFISVTREDAISMVTSTETPSLEPVVAAKLASTPLPRSLLVPMPTPAQTKKITEEPKIAYEQAERSYQESSKEDIVITSAPVERQTSGGVCSSVQEGSLAAGIPGLLLLISPTVVTSGNRMFRGSYRSSDQWDGLSPRRVKDTDCKEENLSFFGETEEKNP